MFKNKSKILKGKVLPISESTALHLRSASLFSESRTSQFRLKLVEFNNKHGVEAATGTFNISRATIHRCNKM